MLTYVVAALRRPARLAVVLSVVVFSLMHTVPGGPFSYEQNMPQYMMENIAAKYGLDRRCTCSTSSWVAAMLQGDFGIPYQSPTETVVEVVLRAWPVTLMIGAISILFAFGVGMLLGTIAAFNQNSWIDNLVTFAATLGMAVPSYVIGSILVHLRRGPAAMAAHGRLGRAQAPDHARDRVLAGSHGHRRPDHARQPAGGDLRGARPARARPRHPDAAHRLALRAQERVDPDDHGAAAAHPGPADRLDLHRGRVHRARPRAGSSRPAR